MNSVNQLKKRSLLVNLGSCRPHEVAVRRPLGDEQIKAQTGLESNPFVDHRQRNLFLKCEMSFSSIHSRDRLRRHSPTIPGRAVRLERSIHDVRDNLFRLIRNRLEHRLSIFLQFFARRVRCAVVVIHHGTDMASNIGHLLRSLWFQNVIVKVGGSVRAQPATSWCPPCVRNSGLPFGPARLDGLPPAPAPATPPSRETSGW